jgi:histidyl-tRNA synthetase
MNQKVQAPRGTQDLLGPTSLAFRRIDQIAYSVAEKFGFEEISTPLFEFSEIFHRTLGETSDMVSKETYSFLDRGGDSLTLRPEGTAGIARAFISNGLAQSLPLKFYYHGPMFRYERPQKGRYRQFHQIGIECLGLESHLADLECLSMATQLLEQLGILSKTVLKINSLGDLESRGRHREKLVEYLTPFKKDLSPDSQLRLEKNPLRILDSKDPMDQKIVSSAPQLSDLLNDSSKKFFDQVIQGLQALGISYQIDPQLVRGIDYYTHTVFEFVTQELGAQGAVLAGGRYDGLIEQMGGPSTCGVGWAAGVERLALLVNENLLQKNNKVIAVIIADDLAEKQALILSQDLRQQGFQVEIPVGGNIGKKLKKASRHQPLYAVILGETEVAQKTYSLKNMQTGEQTTVAWADLLTKLTF